MTKLNINIDHVATLRQARLGFNPDPIQAARIAKKSKVNGIVIHFTSIHDINGLNLKECCMP